MFLLHKKIITEISGSGNKRRSVHDMCSSGSENKRRSVHDMCSSGSRKKKIIECTHKRHTLLTYKAGRYSQQCYDNQPSQLSSTEKKKKCNRSI